MNANPLLEHLEDHDRGLESLNVTAVGQTISNHVIMATAADGGVRLFTQTGTHFVVDISGWYL